MRHHEFETLIDAYLLGRLSDEETERFEGHYFNCPACFEKTTERAVLIKAVKTAGPAPAAEKRAQRPAGASLGGFRLGWAAGLGVALLAAAVIVIVTRAPRPPDIPDSGTRTVRGETLTLLGPAGNVREVPKAFAWSPLAGAVAYTVILEEIDPAWTAETRDASIPIPAEIAARMIPGKSYFWRVKAYTAEGTLLAASARTSFAIAR